MKIFLTGGTGFIGSHLANNLINDGHHLTMLIRSPDKIPAFSSMPRVQIAVGTLKDFSLIAAAISGCDVCIHVALGWGESALEMLHNDTAPSVSLFQCAIDAGVKQIIYTSSTAAVGDLRPRMNAATAVRPNNLYGATKAATENYLLALASIYPIRCNIIRPSYTFGNPVMPGSPIQPDQKIADIVRTAMKNEVISVIKNDGTQFIGVEDLVKLYNDVLFSEYNRSIFFGVGSRYITWEEIARYAIDYIGSGSGIKFDDRGWEKGMFMYDYTSLNRFSIEAHTTIERLHRHIRYLADLEMRLIRYHRA